MNCRVGIRAQNAHNHMTARRIALVVFISAVLAVPVVTVLVAFRRVAADSNALSKCGYNVHALGIAMAEYQMEHGGRLPDASKWVDEIRPYVKDPRVFRCPADPTKGRTSYGMNANLSGKRDAEIADRSDTVLLYEAAQAGANPHGTGQDLPPQGRHRYPRFQTRVTLYWFLSADRAGYVREKPFAPAPHW